jgi:hypothetical protein
MTTTAQALMPELSLVPEVKSKARSRKPQAPATKVRRAPGAKRPKKKKASAEVVSAPAGFGGGSVRFFSAAVTEAMVVGEGIGNPPTWWPADRLRAFWGRPEILDACQLEFSGHMGQLVACTTSTSNRDQVEAVRDFLLRNAASVIHLRSDGAFEIDTVTWRGMPIIIITAPGAIHIVARALLP